MTTAPKKPCRNRQCKLTTNNKNGFCDNCQPAANQREKAVRKEYNTRRNPIVKKWLNSSRYLKTRKIFLSRNPLCKRCSAENRPVLATILDHVTPHKGDVGLFWDASNWQPMCKTCHDRKTAAEDGGFGNPKKDLS